MKKKQSPMSRKTNRCIGRAMHDYSMLEQGDNLLLAVSGGVDSLVLGWVLAHWQKKAPINYSLKAVHVDNGFREEGDSSMSPAELIANQLEHFDVPLHIIEGLVPQEEVSCFSCSKNRRNLLFEYAREHEFNKLAMGHHKDDLIETFMMNTLYSGNISTMLPKQQLFNGRLSIIRPLAYLEKHEIQHLAAKAGIKEVANYCPLADNTRRDKIRMILNNIYKIEPAAKKSMFAALGNVREGYLL